MKPETDQQQSIMQYLLGQARPDEVPALEERLVTDAEFYEEVLIAEDELIDQYLTDQLSESERKSFENFFLSTPERHEKFRFSLTFNKYVAATEPLTEEDPAGVDLPDGVDDAPEPPPKPWYAAFLPSKNPVFAYSLAAAMVLIVGTTSWVAWNSFSGGGASGNLLAVTLAPGGPTRSGGDTPKTISVAGDIGTLELHLLLRSDEYSNYRVTLGDGSSELWTADHLKASDEGSARIVIAKIPARLLSSGDFQIKLAGLATNGQAEDIDSYRFRINR